MAKIKSGRGQSLGGRIFLFFFSLPFFGVGVLMLWMTISSLVTGMLVRTWPKVPATIESMHVEEHRGDGTTYELQAKYRYQVAGNEYVSETVGLHTGADNVGRWHQETFERLEKERAEERTVAYVNPRQPREAYLAPDLRFGMIAFMGIFGLVFGGAGLAMLYGVFGKHGKGKSWEKNAPEVTTRRAAAAKADDPEAAALAKLRPGSEEGQADPPGNEDIDEDDDEEDEDWEEDEEDEGEDYVENVPAYSADQRILKHTNAKGMGFMAFFTLIWNGISWTLVLLFYQDFLEKTRSEPFMWLFICFPLVGILLVWGLISSILRHLRYGVSTLEVATMPGVLGGKFSGAVTCRGSLADSRSVEVSMSCVKETVSTDSDGDRRTTTATQWHDSYELRADSLPRTGGATTIPVLFAVPYDLPMTSGHGNGRVFWKVAVSAIRPGADYSADWEVPVYRTRESVKGYQLEANPLTTFYMDPDPEDALARNGVTVRKTSNGGKSWYFRPTPIRSGAPGCLMFVAVLAGIMALMLSAKAAFIAVFIVGLLAAISIAILLHMVFGRSEIRIENGQLFINGGFAGFNKTTAYPLDLIESVVPSNSMTSGDAVFFKLQFILTDGRKPTAGNQLKGQRLIDALRTSVQEEIDRARQG